ncbi:hypothetical protein EQG63_03740 [Flavobacterium amnicola]|uniref:Uncharacterized protein n=1 Tax=Flavobacterium amnicola TaxID=2506422 RepID=A0A4V1N2A7_9FLAO|nr:hypothetical protein [Flavobacterium amnicola]RXR21061.1 hypothetical protein EQG63_03740 [Flavobacterium amnicola]
MNKIIIALVLSLLGAKSFAQDLVKTINYTVPKKSEIFQIVEEEKKQLSLFFCTNKQISSLRFNENFEIIDSLTTNQIDKKFDEIIGYSLSGDKYYTYWTNGKDYISKAFDFKNKKIESNNYDVILEKEKIIKKLSINNLFYLITVSKNSSLLNFYVFNDGNFTKKVVDFSSKIFYNTYDKEALLSSVFSEATAMENPYSLQNISNDSPASLVFTANKRKCYNYGDQFIITIDNNKTFTQYVSVNLKDFTSDYKIFGQPEIIENVDMTNDSNSFLLEKNLIQIRLNSDNMTIAVKDFENKTVKSFKANSKEEISFKNSDIVQENKNVKSVRILDKSNQFIRKIYNLNPSLSCYINNDNYYLTIGSVSVLENNNAALYGAMLGGLTGALIGAALTSNYSTNNLNSYHERKVVYINSILDKNFNHVAGDAKKLAFDKLRNFVEEHKNVQYRTIFKRGNSLYFAGYTGLNTYSFYSFKD